METPQMMASSYSSSSLPLNQLMGGIGVANQANQLDYAKHLAVLNQPRAVPHAIVPNKEPAMSTRRLVQVFIADPNENVPLDDCMIYEGKLKLTDLTDQELFFEIDVKTVLDAHNAKRVKMIDKKVKERVEHLEAARIRDLKMTVVTVAQF